MDKPVNEIASRLNATASQVIFAWLKSKNIVIVTYVPATYISFYESKLICCSERLRRRIA